MTLPFLATATANPAAQIRQAQAQSEVQQVALDEARLKAGSEVWRAYHGLRTASGSLGAFAVKDLSGSQAGQTVDVKAYDVNGTLLADKSVTIAAGAVQAYTAGDLFCAATFQALPSTPIARIIFTGTDRIDVLMLQVRGQSLAAVPSTAVLTQ